MPANESAQVSAVDRVRTSYKQLAIAARTLNSASDELSVATSVLDAALERLYLGISAWVQISGGDDEDSSYWWGRDIGYTRIKDAWRIALRTRSGYVDQPDEDSEEQWPFAEAPRWMRIEAVAKFPELLDALLKQTQDTTTKLKKRAEQTIELAVAMSEALDEADTTNQKEAGNA